MLAGVHFMAETAKLLNPERTVLISDLRAGCSLAESITAADMRGLKAQYPGVPVVTYVNTSAAVKAESDICCTSGNAVKVVESLGVERVIMIPDEFLAQNIGKQTGVEMITWPGHCEVHERFTPGEVQEFRDANPGVVVLAHPECPPDVVAVSDFAGSTAAMINYVAVNKPKKVMLLTECSMSDNVAVHHPELDFVRPCNLCPHMKRITLANIRHSLETMTHEVTIDPVRGGRRATCGRAHAGHRMSATSLANRPVIVGAGLAGLTVALALAPAPCVVLSPAPLGEGASSAWAQGGVAASVGPDDAAMLHVADTLAAGDGLCDPSAAKRILSEAPDAIARLVALGAVFDRDGAGALKLGLEAAHGRRRIVHAAGDATGREIMRAVVAAVRACPSITILEGVAARRLLVHEGRISGVLAAQGGRARVLATSRVILATGGIGGLFAQSTNPAGCFGMGLALAARAGAVLADLEFVQFHPTALDSPGTPIALVSEAVRGEGAMLVDETGRRFMADVPGRELAPRDVVARAIFAELSAGHHVYPRHARP